MSVKSESPLKGLRVVTTATNLPGPYLCYRLEKLGARILKVEPPVGDPFEKYVASYYKELLGKQRVIRLDLKDPKGLKALRKHFLQSDLWVTASRKDSLEKLGLDWRRVHREFPKLSQLAIESYPEPHANWPGHDLNFQAAAGFLTPPELPVTLFADIAGALEGVIKILSEFKKGTYWSVPLSEGLTAFTGPLRHRLTGNKRNLLGGSLPGYGLYRCRAGWVAAALLEPHSISRFQELAGVSEMTREALALVFLTKTDTEWAAFGKTNGLPINQVMTPTEL